MATKNISDGPGFVRFILVWSSLGPVFLLWAIRGVDALRDSVWIPLCLALFALPNIFLWLIFRRVRKNENTKTIDVERASDQREHLFTYLFAMLIPLFDVSLGGARDVAAMMLAMIFVMFLFWYLRLHYVNLIFAIWGYRIYTVEAKVGIGDGQGSRLVTYAVISRQHHLPSDSILTGYRLGGNVLVDKSDA